MMILQRGRLFAIALAGLAAGCSQYSGSQSFRPSSGHFARVAGAASSYRVVYSFQGGSDGDGPLAPLLFADGKLYGTTSSIGTGPTSDPGGTIFSLTTTGAEEVLHGFSYGPGGYAPDAGLLMVGNELYGTTVNGSYAGTMFRMASDGSHFKTLYSFGARPDGNFPFGTLVHLNHKFYGTTACGGAKDNKTCFQGKHAGGTVFAVSPTGKEVVLHSFGGSDGSQPMQLYDFGGKLFGFTVCGGAYSTTGSCRVKNAGGVVFTIRPDGTYKALHSFNDTDGQYPTSLVDVDGTLYGTTLFGGGGPCAYPKAPGPDGCGVVFRMSGDGSNFQVVYAFGNHAGDGIYPSGLMVLNGKLYGTTECGGSEDIYGCEPLGIGFRVGGTVFSLSEAGTMKILHSFASGSDGSQPQAGVIDVNGKLYGTTEFGGSKNSGTVFELTP